jgi:hypothetical protein
MENAWLYFVVFVLVVSWIRLSFGRHVTHDAACQIGFQRVVSLSNSRHRTAENYAAEQYFLLYLLSVGNPCPPPLTSLPASGAGMKECMPISSPPSSSSYQLTKPGTSGVSVVMSLLPNAAYRSGFRSGVNNTCTCIH